MCWLDTKHSPSIRPFHAQMWRAAFQSVADDIDRLSQDVGKRVAEDPLASIGMARPEKPSTLKQQKNSDKLKGASSSTTKRRRKEEKEKEEAAAAMDPFARRRTRPKSYWAVGNEREQPEEVCVLWLVLCL